MSIQKAKEFAIEMHKGQKYAQGDYFENHVEGVASSVNKSLSEKMGVHHTRFKLLLTVAYLHDTVEDSTATVKDIEEMFGVDVADAVDAMTHREGEEYQDYVHRAIQNDLARFVKYHDIMFNLNQTLKDSIDTNLGKRRCNKYMKALQQFGGIL